MKVYILLGRIKILNGTLVRTNGSVHYVMGGSFDSSKGKYCSCGVAGIGGHSYYELSDRSPPLVQAEIGGVIESNGCKC